MAQILLMNFDEEPTLRLAAFLRAETHEVLIALPTQSYFGWVRGHGEDADLVIIDVSHREKFFWPLLEDISIYRSEQGENPVVLCISRIYRGPRFELDIERKGARLLYV
jgi:hypothetical protein